MPSTTMPPPPESEHITTNYENTSMESRSSSIYSLGLTMLGCILPSLSGDYSMDIVASGIAAGPILDGYNISPLDPGLGVISVDDSISMYHVDFNYPDKDKATLSPFLSAYEFLYAENMRTQNVTPTQSSTALNGQDDVEEQPSNYSQQKIDPNSHVEAIERLVDSNRDEIRRLAAEGRRRTLLQVSKN